MRHARAAKSAAQCDARWRMAWLVKDWSSIVGHDETKDLSHQPTKTLTRRTRSPALISKPSLRSVGTFVFAGGGKPTGPNRKQLCGQSRLCYAGRTTAQAGWGLNQFGKSSGNNYDS